MASNKIRITVSDFDKRQLEIDFDFDWNLVEDIKQITGRQYNDTNEVWRVSLNERNLVEFLSFCQKNDITISNDEVKKVVEKVKEDAQKKHDKYEKNKKLATKKEPDIEKVYGLRRGMSLYPFQRVAVEYIEKNKNVLIGDSMGLGKTVETLGAMEHLESYPTLIVCPASLKQNWKNEAKNWLPKKRSINIINASDDDPTFRRRVIIINYALLRKYKDTLLEKDWEMIVADESHYLKNEDAKRTQNFKKVAKDVPYKLLLSGTPITNRPSELISQLKILNVFEDEFGGFWEYVNKFCNAEQTQFGLDISGASNLKELHEKLISTCYVRRNKEDVLEQLPEKSRQVVKFDIINKDEYRKVENNIVQYFRDKALQDDEFQEKIDGLPEFQQEKLKKERASKAMSKAIGAEHLVKLSELRKVTAKGKLKPITDWIDNFIKSEQKLVLFAHHTAVCDAVEEKYDCLKITGEVPSEDRQEIVDKFQNDSDEQLIILNIAAGGVGITLTAASHVGFIELPWSPAAVDQAEDRCHRISQENAVNIYYLLAENTIDEKVHGLIEKKRKVTNKVNAGKDLTEEDLKELEKESDVTKQLVKDLLQKN